LKTLLSSPRRRTILALSGELGSGKTAFVQGLAQALGIREKIQSPTFVLMKWYQIPEPSQRFHRFHQFHHFVHVDAYRLDRPSEARHLNLKSIFRDPDALVAIEWADRIRRFIPKKAIWIHFRHKAKTKRLITIRS
jgi:tRNA threonylcarbamoyladenosine biosynthesis protein TsaE